MICKQNFKNKLKSDGKKYKPSATDKNVTPYVNVQLRPISCLCFLNMFTNIHVYLFIFICGHLHKDVTFYLWSFHFTSFYRT